ncbi:hypothetical protein DFO70_1573, partial [Cytobacillus firmus]
NNVNNPFFIDYSFINSKNNDYLSGTSNKDKYEITNFFKEERCEYFSNIISICKNNLSPNDTVNFGGEVYLVLEQNGADGNIDFIGIKKPEKDTINIATLTYLYGQSLKKAFEKIIIKMKDNSKLNLFIIGRGPLKEYIEMFARINNVEERVLIIESLINPFKLIGLCDFYIPVPNSRLNTIDWNIKSAYISGYIYIPGFSQESPDACEKKLLFKDTDGNVVREVLVDNKYIDWLTRHPNHGNDFVNYDFAWFGKWIDFKELMLPMGNFFISVKIIQGELELEAPLINSISREIPENHRIDDCLYSFIENKELNKHISINVSSGNIVGRSNAVKWKDKKVYLSGYSYIKNIEENSPNEHKELLIKDKNDQIITKISLTSKKVEWLLSHSNHGNGKLDYRFAWFGNWLDVTQLPSKNGIYKLFVLVNNSNIDKEIQYRNTIDHAIDDSIIEFERHSYQFFEGENKEILLKVFSL